MSNNTNKGTHTMINIDNTNQDQVKNNKSPKDQWLDHKRSEVYGTEQPPITVKSTHFTNVILDHLIDKYGLNLTQVRILFTLRKSIIKDDFGNVLINLTESKWISRKQLAEKLGKSKKTIANEETRLIKMGLLESSGKKGCFDGRAYAAGDELIIEMTGTRLIKPSTSFDPLPEKRATTVTRETGNDSYPGDGIHSNNILDDQISYTDYPINNLNDVLNLSEMMIKGLKRLTDDEIKKVMAMVKPKIYDYEKMNEHELKKLLRQTLAEAGVDVRHIFNPDLPAKKDMSDKQFLYLASEIYYGHFRFGDELSYLREKLVCLASIHGKRFMLDYLQSCRDNRKLDGKSLSEIVIGKIFENYLSKGKK